MPNASLIWWIFIDSNTGHNQENASRQEKGRLETSNGVLIRHETVAFPGSGVIATASAASSRWIFPYAEGPGYAIQSKVRGWFCSGITEIPERAFPYFTNLEEIEIEPGLKSIGKEAFTAVMIWKTGSFRQCDKDRRGYHLTGYF